MNNFDNDNGTVLEELRTLELWADGKITPFRRWKCKEFQCTFGQANLRCITSACRGAVTSPESADPSEIDQIRDRPRDTTSTRHGHHMQSEAT